MARESWRSVAFAREHVIDAIGAEYWGGLESRLATGRTAGLFGDELATLAKAKSDLSHALALLENAIQRIDATRSVAFHANALATLEQARMHAAQAGWRANALDEPTFRQSKSQPVILAVSVQLRMGADVATKSYERLKENATNGLHALERFVDHCVHHDSDEPTRETIQRHFAAPFSEKRKRRKNDPRQALIRRPAETAALAWCADARRERPQLSINGGLLAHAAIAAAIEPPCGTSGEFRARRAHWDRILRSSHKSAVSRAPM